MNDAAELALVAGNFLEHAIDVATLRNVRCKHGDGGAPLAHRIDDAASILIGRARPAAEIKMAGAVLREPLCNLEAKSGDATSDEIRRLGLKNDRMGGVVGDGRIVGVVRRRRSCRYAAPWPCGGTRRSLATAGSFRPARERAAPLPRSASTLSSSSAGHPGVRPQAAPGCDREERDVSAQRAQADRRVGIDVALADLQESSAGGEQIEAFFEDGPATN